MSTLVNPVGWFKFVPRCAVHIDSETFTTQGVGELAATEPRQAVFEVMHDLNNVLAGILNYAALAADGLRQELDRRQLEADGGFAVLVEDIDQIRDAARRAVSLTHHLARSEVADRADRIDTLDVLDGPDPFERDDPDDVTGPCP